ncbi:WD40-repeat-containing domain protein [Aspergillus pseudoustus]|uniref:WD40-repeat-containing domain protein n=1 Tax=Aspergillus pseudoustus TaxID=1810923 RepID=A0ABR4K7N9_9EURO
MSSLIEHIDACLPITTLKALEFKEIRLLLTGQGPFIRVCEEESAEVLAYYKAFKRSAVHGFAVLHREEQESGTAKVQLLAWGDRSLRLIDLGYSKDGHANLTVSVAASSAEYYAPDWLLAGCASTTTEGCAAYLVTAHNAVLGLTIVKVPSTSFGKTLELRQLVVGVKSILYSANIISLSPSHVLIAAGTVFGEIIVWSCFALGSEGSTIKVTSSIHHFFTGHEGSIFDVKISPEIVNLHGDRPGRLLASCSDDRTVRIWDISDCERADPNEPSPYSTDGFELKSTGFGHVKGEPEVTSESCIASAFGHGARIWGVNFVAARSRQDKIGLVSRGEDAHCLVWDLSWGRSASQKSEFKLNNVCSLRCHNGKHIWSIETVEDGTETTVYSGGADGAVRTFKLNAEHGVIECPNRTTRVPIATSSEGSEAAAKVLMRAFGFVSSDRFLATTSLGEIQLGWVEFPDSLDRRVVRETLSVEESLRSYAIISGLPSKGVAVFGDQKGVIRLYEHESRTITTVADIGQRPVGLHALDYQPKTSNGSAAMTFLATYATHDTADLLYIHLLHKAEPHVGKTTLHLPQGFDITCASLINNNDYLAIGSKLGSLVVYRMKNSDSLQPLLKLARFHSKEGVNQILPFSVLSPTESTLSTHFISCGRDGTYRVSSLDVLQSSEETVSIRTVHSPTALNFNIEGAYVDQSSQNLMFYGFGGMEFVIWNENTQSEVARIHCGGAHRRWAFQASTERRGHALLLWARGGLNASHLNVSKSRTICAGGHGREIKTLGSVQKPDGRPLFVTGAEDTTLRVFAPRSNSTPDGGALECARVLNAHDSAPQHIGFSRDARFMFTSSAMEDFYVWRIGSIPVFGLTAALLGWCPKSQPNSELRITCFDILEVEDSGGEPSFILCLTYSNSTISIFHLSCSADEGRFTLLANGTYTSNCLTQVRFLQNQSSLCLITTSTDGHFTLWDVTTVLTPYYTITPTPTPTLRLKQPLDNNISITPEKIVCESRHQIHSNSIKSIDLAPLSSTTTLVIAGGDDNSVTLSLLYNADAKEENTETSDRVAAATAATVSVPDAHTASVNAVKLISQSSVVVQGDEGKEEEAVRLSFVSSGNDHRVKIWHVDIAAGERPTINDIQMQNVVDRFSPVADISSLDVVRDQGETKLLVCGVGMEYFKVAL